MASTVSQNHVLRQEVRYHRTAFTVACVITAVALGLLTTSLLMHPATASMVRIQAVLFTSAFFPLGFIGLGLMLTHGWP